MAKFAEQRVGVLVDIQNLYYSARVLYNKKVNFKNVLMAAAEERKLIRAIAYGIKTVEATEEKFFEALQKSGFEVKTKDLQIFPDGSKKGDWDVGLAVDAISLSKLLDVVVIISGDGDYEPLVEYLKFSGLIVETMGFKRSTSSKLTEAANNFVDLEESKEKVLLK